MPIKDFALSEMQILHNTKIKVYPDGSTNITYCKKPIFREAGYEAREREEPDGVVAETKPYKEQDELEDSREQAEAEEKKNSRDRSAEMIRLHRDKVRDIVLMNDFSHFLTITINPEQFDSFDVKLVRKKLQRWLKDQSNRKGLQYVLIPEYHKSGRIHAHALVNDVFNLVDSGLQTSSGKPIYNCPEWRYGFSTAIPLDENKLRVANYVTKYITKGSDKIFGKYFWSSKNIRREPHVILCDTDFDSVLAQTYQPLAYNEDLQFKYECNLTYLHDDGFERSCDECSALATEGLCYEG